MAITLDTSFEETRNFQPPNLRPDFGFIGRASGAAMLGAQESVLLTGAHAALKKLEGISAEQRGEEPLTEEAHKELFGDSIPFVKGEYRKQAELRNQYFTTRRRAEFKSQDFGLVPQLGFGILGNSVDAPLMAVPGLAAVGKVQAFAHARRTGLSFKAAEEFIKRSNGIPTIKKAMAGAATEQLLETQAVYSLSSYTGRDYGAMDRVMDFAFGLGVASGINIPLISHSKKVAREQGRIISDLRAMEAFFEHGDYAEGASKLLEFSESLGIGVRIDPETQAILSKEPDQRTPEDQAIVEAFLTRHMDAIEAENAKSSVQMDPDKPIAEAKAEVDRKMRDIHQGTTEIPPKVAKAEARFHAAEEALNTTKQEMEALRSEGKEIPEELNTRFEQELEEFDTSGEELRDLDFDGTMDALDEGSKPTVDISGSTRKSPFFQKDVTKFQGATKLISRGSPRSSSAAYAEAAGELANSGKYDESDIVGVSVEGNRSGRVGPDYAEIDKAIEAKANFQIDKPADRNRGYNVGEREVAAYLKKKGYEEPNSDGLFVPAGRAAPTKSAAKSPEPVFTKADSDKVIDAADRFMQALGFDVRVRAKRKEGSMAHYDSDTEDINLDPNVRPDRALQLTFHELVHHFRDTNKKVYDSLSAVVDRFRGDKVFMDKIMSPELRSRYEENFGKEPQFAAEKMSVEETAWFMTEATKHPEFWQALKQRDPKVFEQFKLWLRRLWDMIVGNRRIDRSTMTADQKLAMRQFGEILAAAESVDFGGRGRGQGTMDALDPDSQGKGRLREATENLKPLAAQVFNLARKGKKVPEDLAAAHKAARAEWEEALRESNGEMGSLDDPSPTRRTQAANAAARKLDRELTESNKRKADQVRERELAEHDKVVEEGSQDSEVNALDPESLQKKLLDFATTFKMPEGFKPADGSKTPSNTEVWQEYKKARDTFLDELGISGGNAGIGAFAVDNIHNAYQRLIWLQDHIIEFFGEVPPAQVMRNKQSFEDYKFFEYQVSKGNISVGEARSAYLQRAEEIVQNVAISETRSLEAILRIEDRVRTQGGGKLGAIKFLKTLIDGRERRGVATKDNSMEAKVLAQIQEDQGALRHVLVQHGLYDIFSGVSTVSAESLRNRFLHTVASETGQQMYGKKLQEAHKLFWEDLLAGARRQEVPDNWKGVKPLEDVFNAYMATLGRQRNQLNSIGAGIRFREGYSGLSHRWDDGTILRVGEAEWFKDMNQAIDWEATEAAHGGVLSVETDKTGAVMGSKPFNKKDFLEQWLFEIRNKEREVHSSEDSSKSFGHHLKVVLKPESELAMMTKYSGHTSPGILFMDQVRHRSEVIAVGNTLGPRPLPNFDTIVSRLGLDPEMTIKEAVIGPDKIQNLNLTSLMWSIRQLTGSLDNPVDMRLAEGAKNVRRVSNLAFLPLSGVSAVTDIPMIALRLNQQGVLKMEDMGSFMFKYYQSHKRNLGSDEAVREAFEREGAGLDSALNAAAARIAIGDPNNPSALSKVNDVMFTVNYLNGITRSGQETYVDILTQAMARQFDEGTLDPMLQTNLEAHGFTEADMSILRDSVIEGADGVRRVGPSSVSDPKVSRKLREYFLQNMNEAVIFPDVGSQAFLRMGTRSGTWAGETARIGLQYASFPLAMTRITMRKFMTTYQGTNAWTAHQTGMMQMTAFAGSMLAMGYMATVIKDILRGREPMSLSNMSSKGWGRVVAQSGLTGIFEQVFDLGQGNVRGATAPLPGTLLKAANSGSVAEVVDDLRPFYGSTYPVVGSAGSQIFGAAFGESLQELQNRRRIALETMYQQKP